MRSHEELAELGRAIDDDQRYTDRLIAAQNAAQTKEEFNAIWTAHCVKHDQWAIENEEVPDLGQAEMDEIRDQRAEEREAALTDLDVSRETLPKRTVGQIFEPEPVEVDEREAAQQAELDEAVAKQRAEDSRRLSENEAANYASGHAIIEADEADDSEE